MIKRVYGATDGLQVAFERDGATGLFTASVPAVAGGEYLVSLYAEDEAGNTSFFATALFAVDTSRLCVSVYVLDFAVRSDTDTRTAVSSGGIRAACGETAYRAAAALSPIDLSVRRCERCGR